MAEMAVKPIAQKCVDILNERGWVQGQYENEDGAVCALGALQFALGGNLYELIHSEPGGGKTQIRSGLDNSELELRLRIEILLKVHLGMTIVKYNDMDGRTVDDIIHVFEELE